MTLVLMIIAVLFAYLLGSLSSAVFVCRIFGLPDPRTEGSKNPGATNVLRLGGKKLAALVFVGDFLKGSIPVMVAGFFLHPIYLGWVGLAAIIGHLYPVFFQFKGGKGVATAAGVLFALSWPLGLAVFATWFIIALLFRYSSLAAVIATLLVPIYGIWLVDRYTLISLIIIALLVLWRHHDNIKRLFAGTEVKIGRSS
jgi:glycerol-3-phosphate acyltransferase PlsY